MKHDPALLFFSSSSALLLLVSMPATYAVVAPFHSSGNWPGIALALMTLLAFEVGAVGCKLVTLAIPTWNRRMNALTVVLLGMTTLANYANGYDLFSSSSLSATLASIRSAGYGGLVAIIYSATIPVLLFVFLSATVARARQLQATAVVPDTSLADRRDTAILAALEALTERLASSQVTVLDEATTSKALPLDSEALELDTVASSGYPCPHCKTLLAKPGLVGLAKRYGHCDHCKEVR